MRHPPRPYRVATSAEATSFAVIPWLNLRRQAPPPPRFPPSDLVHSDSHPRPLHVRPRPPVAFTDTEEMSSAAIPWSRPQRRPPLLLSPWGLFQSDIPHGHARVHVHGGDILCGHTVGDPAALPEMPRPPDVDCHSSGSGDGSNPPPPPPVRSVLRNKTQLHLKGQRQWGRTLTMSRRAPQVTIIIYRLSPVARCTGDIVGRDLWGGICSFRKGCLF